MLNQTTKTKETGGTQIEELGGLGQPVWQKERRLEAELMSLVAVELQVGLGMYPGML